MTDILPILKMENVNEFLVTGISFGTFHVMAIASTFASSKVNDKHDDFLPKYIGMGLRAPYLGSDSCIRLDLDNHLNMSFTSKSTNTTFVDHMIASAFLYTQEKSSSAFDEPGFLLKTLIRCLNPGALENLKHVKNDYSDLMERTTIGMDRSVIDSIFCYMYDCGSETLLDHVFDVDSIQKDLPVVIWYAKDDEDCPPTNGEYLSSGKKIVKCTESSTCVFEGYRHVGCAFIDHPQFLEDLVPTACS
jgi:hypothetical protein